MRLGRTGDFLGDSSILEDIRQRAGTISLVRLLNSTLLAAPVVALVVLGYRQRWMSEDAFISLRVVDQILAGNGPVFNLGERVEAHTNPLWVAILSAFGWLGADIVMVALFLGIVLSAIGMLTGLTAAARLEQDSTGEADGGRPPLLIPIGAAMFISIPVVADFVTSGLETGLGFGWLGISFWILVQLGVNGASMPRWRWYAGSLVLGLGPLIRPDFAIFSAGFLLALLALRHWSREARLSVRDVLLLGVAAGTLPVAYQIFRMGYYAAIVPNTALAKEAGRSNWAQGEIYLRDFVDPYMLWIPLGVLLGWWALKLVGQARRRRWSHLVLLAVPVVTAALYAVYVVRVGGDFMHGRLLLPAFFAMLLPLAAVRIPLRLRPVPILVGIAVVGLLIYGYMAATSMESPLGPELDEETGLVDERAYYVDETENPNPVTTADYEASEFRGAERGVETREYMSNGGPRAVLLWDRELPVAEHVPDEIDVVIADGNIGILSYIAGRSVHTVDRMGLADPIASRLELEERDRPGHEKVLPSVWVGARFTALEPEDVGEQEFTDARAALQCEQLAELQEAVTAPMTAGRFLENIQKSWAFHTLRIPPEPADARTRFCAD